MTNVLDKVVSCPTLPSLPEVAVRVIQLARDPDATVSEFAEIIEKDQAIAAKLLRTVNSSHYGLASPCTTIHRAVGHLGSDEVRSLVLGFSLIGSFKNPHLGGGFDLQGHWRRSIFGSSSARAISHRVCYGDPEEAFVSSLLQDIGMFAASITLGDDYSLAIADAGESHFDIEKIEQERFGFTHGIAGAMLAERWGLPESLVEAIRFHHHPDNASPANHDLARIVSLSTLAAESLSVEFPQATVARFQSQLRDWFGISEEDFEALFQAIVDGAADLSRLFQVDTGKAPDINAILNQAQDGQVEALSSTNRHRSALEARVVELENQNFTDDVTGIANRRWFDQELELAIPQVVAGEPMAVLMFYADTLMSVNEAHGFKAGDRVLIELAQRSARAVGDDGLVCRYSGVVFAMIARGADRSIGLRIAEAIRVEIEARPFDLRDVPDCLEELNITVSVGVAAVNKAFCDSNYDPSVILREADIAMQTAREKGGNCCCLNCISKAEQAKAS